MSLDMLWKGKTISWRTNLKVNVNHTPPEGVTKTNSNLCKIQVIVSVFVFGHVINTHKLIPPDDHSSAEAVTSEKPKVCKVYTIGNGNECLVNWSETEGMFILLLPNPSIDNTFISYISAVSSVLMIRRLPTAPVSCGVRRSDVPHLCRRFCVLTIRQWTM